LEAFKYPAEKLIVGLGGVATVDGGLGFLQALGAEFLNRRRKAPGPGFRRPASAR